MEKFNFVAEKTVLSLIHIKKNAERQRPYFTNDERVALMKEIGFGIWSVDGFKCDHCERTEPEVKLALCSACKDVWYCVGSDCFKLGWKRRHKKECISKEKMEYTLDSDCLNDIRNGAVRVCPNLLANESHYFIAYDLKNQEAFEVLSDRTINCIGRKKMDDNDKYEMADRIAKKFFS